MRVASLFTGVGGFDLGLERAGHRVVLQVELDPFRYSILRRHWPEVPVVRDVREVRAGEPLRPGAVDLICGGFPCRDLSIVGKRRGIESADSEDGSGLFFELCRVADDLLRPGGWLLIENVPGMLTSNGGRDFAVLVRTLGDLGFHDLAWRVLDSRLHGVPQSRRRVFVLARRADGDAARRVLLEPQGRAGHPRAGGQAWEGDPGGDVDGAPGHDLGVAIARGEVARALTARLGTSGWDLTDAEGNLFVPVAVAENQRGEVLEVPYARTLVAGGGKPGQGYPLIRIGPVLRRLTPTECERLQGFPDGWTIPSGPSLVSAPSWYDLPPERRDPAPINLPPHAPRWEAMGRAVTVPVAEAIGQRLAAWTSE